MFREAESCMQRQEKEVDVQTVEPRDKENVGD